MALDKRIVKQRTLKIMALIWWFPCSAALSSLGLDDAFIVTMFFSVSIPFIAASCIIVHRVVKKDSLTDLFGHISTFKTAFFVTFMFYTFLPIFGFLSLGLIFISEFFMSGTGEEVSKISGVKETTLMVIVLGLFAPTFFINSLLIWVYKFLRKVSDKIKNRKADLDSEVKDE